MRCPKCGNTLYNYASHSCAACGFKYKVDEPEVAHKQLDEPIHPIIQFILWLGGGVLFLWLFEVIVGQPWPGFH